MKYALGFQFVCKTHGDTGEVIAQLTRTDVNGMHRSYEIQWTDKDGHYHEVQEYSEESLDSKVGAR